MVTERNFLDIYPFWKWDTKIIPVFKEGEQITPEYIRMEEGITTAPPLLTEPDLVALMDKNGIGTDATIAEHIHKIQERKYAVIEGRQFKPTTLGEAIVAGYNFIGLRLLSQPNLRAKTEADMKDISSQKKNKAQVLDENIQLYRIIFQDINKDARKLDKALSKYFSQTSTTNQRNMSGQSQDLLPGGNNPPDSPGILCDCGTPASQSVVKKQNANQGRSFYACPNRVCKFFQWADGEGNLQQQEPNTSTIGGGWNSGTNRPQSGNFGGFKGVYEPSHKIGYTQKS